MFIKNLALATAILLGILLLPITADAQCFNNGNGVMDRCAVPQNGGYAEVVPASYLQPGYYPIQTGTWWHKSHRYGSWWENSYSYGSHSNHANRHNWSDRHRYGSPGGNGYGPAVYGNGTRYNNGNGNAPGANGYTGSAKQQVRNPNGNGSSDPGGFSRSPYWQDATNNGRGAYDGPPAFDYNGYGMHDNPPTKEELNRLGISSEIPKHYTNLGTHDNPPTAKELQKLGDDSSLPEGYAALGDFTK